MLSNNQEQHASYASIKHRKTDLFSLQPQDGPTRRPADRNRSSLFQNDEPIARATKVDRMKSDIFFSEYVPSGPSAPKRQEIKVEEKANTYDQEAQYYADEQTHYAPQETQQYAQEPHYIPQEYSQNEIQYAREQAQYQEPAAEPDYYDNSTASRRAAIVKAFKSNVFEDEAVQTPRGARRHYNVSQQSDIFHRSDVPAGRYARVNEQTEVKSTRVEVHSSSFANIFGAADEQNEGTRV
jgi:hypothetical protein